MRAIRAIFGAGAAFDIDEGAELEGIVWVEFAMDFLGMEEEVHERGLEEFLGILF